MANEELLNQKSMIGALGERLVISGRTGRLVHVHHVDYPMPALISKGSVESLRPKDTFDHALAQWLADYSRNGPSPKV